MARKGSPNKSRNNKQKQKPKQNEPRVIVKTVAVPSQMGIGAMIGDRLQKFAESTFSRLVGRGDYTLQDNVDEIKKNSLFTNTPAKTLRFGSNPSQVIIEHSEFIGNITSSPTVGGFKSTVFPCDPTNTTSFPWLAQIASNFEQYEVEGLVYRIESLSGTAVSGSDSSLGSLSTAFLYDPTSEIPVNKQQMLQLYGSNTSCVSKSQLLGVECAKDSQAFDKLYINEGETDSTRFNTKGNFVIATTGLKASNQTVCELWVHYRIKLLFPKLSQVALSSPDCLYVASTFTTTDISTPATYYSNSMTISPKTTNQIYINGLSKGAYVMVSVTVAGTAATLWSSAASSLQGGATVVDSSLPSASGSGSGGAVTFTCARTFLITDASLNAVWLNTAVIATAGATSGVAQFRILTLPEYNANNWTAAEQIILN